MIYRKKLKHYNISSHAHSLTFSCYKSNEYLIDERACQILENELITLKEEENFHVWAFVFMPNHVHLFIFPLNDNYSISIILKKLKGRMSKKYSEYLINSNPIKRRKILVPFSNGEYFLFWQRGGGYDRNIFNPKYVYNTIKYIENNPVRKGLVDYASQWRWSSAYTKKYKVGLIPDESTLPVIML